MSRVVLLTKITMPRQRAPILRRPALAKKWKFVLENGFSLVHAGAGYGKSTALATYLADQQGQTCWLNLAEDDTDLSHFLACLVAAIQLSYPHFSLPPDVSPAAAGQTSGDNLLKGMIEQLYGLGEDVLMVLDNYHTIPEGSPTDLWVQQFVRHLPANARVVLLSRAKPAWPWLDLMRVRGEVREVTESDLAFSREEMEALFLDEYRCPLTAEQLSQVESYSAGWVTALRSIGELANQQPIAQLALAESLADRYVQQLLELEVISKLEPVMHHFLLECAALDSLTAAHCRALLADGERLLQEAFRRHLFLRQEADDMYRFHPVFHRLLRQKLAADPKRYMGIHRRAARYYFSLGETENALNHLAEIADWEQMGEWLQQLLQQGEKREHLYDRIQMLPDAVKDRYYWLWYYQAEAERFRSHYPQAAVAYERFHALAERAGDRTAQCAALEGQARVYLESVQGIKAESLLKQAIQLLDPHDREMAPRLYRLLAEIYTNRGNAVEAEQWYRRSLEWERESAVEVEARLLFRTGRLQESVRLLEKSWSVEKSERKAHLTRSYRETSLLLAFVYGLNGDYEKGLAVADEAIRLGVAAHSPFVEALGYIRKAHCALLDAKHPAEQIRTLYIQGLTMMEELQSTRGKAELFLGLTLYYGREKALETALSHARRGLQETEAIRDDWVNGLIKLGMGIAYAHSGDYEAAAQVFQECVSQLSVCGDSYTVTISYLWLSYMAYVQKDWELFVPTVTQALSAIQSGEYHFLLQRPTMLTPSDVQTLMPVLIEAQKRQIHPDYVSHLLTDLGLHNVSFHPGYTLRVQTLGQFRVWLGEQELSEKAWQREKAKQLFQLLLTRRRQLLIKEEIFQHLWPDLEDEAAARDFKVALNALNKALEPNREARAHAFFIQRHGSSYGFNLASGYQIDAEEFERLVSRGLEEKEAQQAVVYLEKGLAIYQGEYLPDCRYEDWCMEERDRLHMLYLRGAEKLAQHFVDLSRYDTAIRWCEAILQADDCWEEAYRLLMYIYYRKNNRAQARKWYEKCVDKLQRQLGVQPLPSTRQTYEMIMENR